jgi:hypothetical protein
MVKCNLAESPHLMKEFDSWKFWLSSAALFAGILAVGLLK